MGVIIGSARIDENGRASGGAAGDQKQSTTPDYTGEVSMQNFYVHTKGWYVLHPQDPEVAIRLAAAMITACNNANIGYDQLQRLGVVTNGTGSKVKTECDCSSLVRACVREATGKDPGNFTTANEATMLEATGLFEDKKNYTTGMTLYTGDILVTKTKGHTAIVTAGASLTTAQTNAYYPVYYGSTTSIVAALAQIGEKDTSYTHRSKIAAANNISGYSGTAVQNTQMLNLLKQGRLRKA